MQYVRIKSTNEVGIDENPISLLSSKLIRKIKDDQTYRIPTEDLELLEFDDSPIQAGDEVIFSGNRDWYKGSCNRKYFGIIKKIKEAYGGYCFLEASFCNFEDAAILKEELKKIKKTNIVNGIYKEKEIPLTKGNAKVGMKVKCINRDGNFHITVGNIYEVLSYSEDYFRTKCDNGSIKLYKYKNFIIFSDQNTDCIVSENINKISNTEKIAVEENMNITKVMMEKTLFEIRVIDKRNESLLISRETIDTSSEKLRNSILAECLRKDKDITIEDLHIYVRSITSYEVEIEEK